MFEIRKMSLLRKVVLSHKGTKFSPVQFTDIEKFVVPRVLVSLWHLSFFYFSEWTQRLILLSQSNEFQVRGSVANGILV